MAGSCKSSQNNLKKLSKICKKPGNYPKKSVLILKSPKKPIEGY
jgi:hypothetical protein